MNMTPEPVPADRLTDLLEAAERFAPQTATEIPVGEYLIWRAITYRPSNMDELRCAVAVARDSGIEWTRIADIVGLTVSEAQRRYDSSQPS